MPWAFIATDVFRCPKTLSSRRFPPEYFRGEYWGEADCGGSQRHRQPQPVVEQNSACGAWTGWLAACLDGMGKKDSRRARNW